MSLTLDTLTDLHALVARRRTGADWEYVLTDWTTSWYAR